MKQLNKMENQNKVIIDRLNHLISIAEDGKEGYENAAENVKDLTIKNLFLQISEERSRYAAELRETVHHYNGESEDKGGGPLGVLHRVWMDLKAVFSGGDTESIINACITGEESAIKDYKEVLEDGTLSHDERELISNQMKGIETALTNIKVHAHLKS